MGWSELLDRLKDRNSGVDFELVWTVAVSGLVLTGADSRLAWTGVDSGLDSGITGKMSSLLGVVLLSRSKSIA